MIAEKTKEIIAAAQEKRKQKGPSVRAQRLQSDGLFGRTTAAVRRMDLDRKIRAIREERKGTGKTRKIKRIRAELRASETLAKAA